MKKNFTYRVATMDDVDSIRALMDLAIYELQKDYLDKKQLDAAHEHMGIDFTLAQPVPKTHAKTTADLSPRLPASHCAGFQPPNDQTVGKPEEQRGENSESVESKK